MSDGDGGDAVIDEDAKNPGVLDGEPAEAAAAGSAPGTKKRKILYNKAEQQKLFDDYNSKKSQALQKCIGAFNTAKEWALVTDMTWLHNVLLFLEDMQAIELTTQKKGNQSFYEQAHSLIEKINNNFQKIGIPEERSEFREKDHTRQKKPFNKKFKFWTSPYIKENMQSGKKLLDIFFQSKWSLFVDQADLSITSHLNSSCSILAEGLVPHWTMYIGDQFLRTFFVQLLNYHKMVSTENQRQKVTFVKMYKDELKSYVSRIKQSFMMRIVKKKSTEFTMGRKGYKVKNLSPSLTLWIMYQNNLPYRTSGSQQSEMIKFQQIVRKLFIGKLEDAETIEVKDNLEYIERAWKSGIPTRFVSTSFHPIELSYVLEYMYGKDRFKMLQWEQFIRWQTSEEEESDEEDDEEEFDEEDDEEEDDEEGGNE